MSAHSSLLNEHRLNQAPLREYTDRVYTHKREKGDQEMHSSPFKFTLALMLVAIPFAAAQAKLPPAASQESRLQAGHPAAAFTELLFLPWA